MARTIRNEFDKKLTYESLMQAHIKSRKQKGYRNEIILFNLKQEEYIMWLYEQLKTQKYRHEQNGDTSLTRNIPNFAHASSKKLIIKRQFFNAIRNWGIIKKRTTPTIELTEGVITTMLVIATSTQLRIVTTTIRLTRTTTMARAQDSNINFQIIYFKE